MARVDTCRTIPLKVKAASAGTLDGSSIPAEQSFSLTWMVESPVTSPAGQAAGLVTGVSVANAPSGRSCARTIS